MRDPMPWWNERVRCAREQANVIAAPPEEYVPLEEAKIAPDIVWSLLNPAIVEEALPRYNAGHYADAVETAIKVVCREVRQKTGLREDGTTLMEKAFSTKKPLLAFDDPIPETQKNMQQGYLLLFSGTIQAVRNPKAHSLVEIDARRCIHFLFLASLLADKVAEATACIPQ
jgi:uncharacterized protein (TIGR02391 family)